MANGQAAEDPDRLPWLSDTRRPPRSRESVSLLFWAFLAIVLVAGFSYWLGVKSVGQPDAFTDVLGGSGPEVTETLPEPAGSASVPPPAEVQAPGLPDVSPVAEPVPVPIPGVVRARPAVEDAPPVQEFARPEPAPKARRVAPPTPSNRLAKPKTVARPAPARASVRKKQVARPVRPRLQAWPADRSAGAYGRVVRVGTFYSRRQAKQGWGRIVRVYPGIRRLRAVVVPQTSLRNGHTYYRLQFGTTSQAHSAVLCQRMRVVGQSCVTVGLPGRA